MTPDERRAHRAAYMREYRKANPDYVAKGKARQAKRYDRAKATESKREYVQRIREAGVHTETLIARDEFNALLRQQRGVCAICKKPETKLSAKGRVRRLSIDHDHKTGRIRALLCSRCNSVVGFLEDNYRLGEKVVEYLRIQEMTGAMWVMNEAIGGDAPLRSRRHKSVDRQKEAADVMQRAVG